MNPQRWRVAGILLLGVAALLVIGALVSVLTAGDPATAQLSILRDQNDALDTLSAAAGVLRGVVLGAFAGVAFFLGLSCFAASAVGEARQQRADILIELTALRARAERREPHA